MRGLLWQACWLHEGFVGFMRGLLWQACWLHEGFVVAGNVQHDQ